MGSRPAPRKHPRHDLKSKTAAVSKRAKLESLRIHDLRHTHERRRAGATLGLPIIGKLLGHAQASTTARARCRHGQHLRGRTYYFASRRTVFKQLEQSAGVLASKLSSDRFVRDQWNELRINLAASDKQGRPDEAPSRRRAVGHGFCVTSIAGPHGVTVREVKVGPSRSAIRC